jgi:hypothetical protein
MGRENDQRPSSKLAVEVPYHVRAVGVVEHVFGEALLGFGRRVAIHHRSSMLYPICEEIRRLYF